MATDTLAVQAATYRDARGNLARVKFFIAYDHAAPLDARTVGLNVITAINGLTNCFSLNGYGPFSEVAGEGYGTVATFEDVEDKARITFVDSAGGLHRLDIPAPIGTGGGNIFLADAETVSPAKIAALTTALTTAVTAAFVSNRGKQPIASVLGGVRRRSKSRRKLTVYSKSANLDEPGL